MVPRRHGSSSRAGALLVAAAAVASLTMGCRGSGHDAGLAPRAPLLDAAKPVRRTYEHAAMGTTFRLTLFAPDTEEADRSAAAAFQRVDRIEAASTDYQASSEARRLPAASGGGWVAVSPELALVLESTERVMSAGLGAFDPTVGALTRRWRRALRQHRWPAQADWAAAAAAVGWHRFVELKVEDGGSWCRVEDPRVELDFGGIAKGVAVDQALAVLEERGIRSALMDGGGDLCALDPPPGEAGWRVEVLPFGEKSSTRLRFLLSRAAIATSGDVYQSGGLEGVPLAGIENAGGSQAAVHYGHVVDPRSGLPLPSPRASVMTAPTAAEADALATARLVVGPVATGVVALEGGLFFGSEDEEPCVGEHFPHDGVVPLPSVTSTSDRLRSDESLQRHRHE